MTPYNFFDGVVVSDFRLHQALPKAGGAQEITQPLTVLAGREPVNGQAYELQHTWSAANNEDVLSCYRHNKQGEKSYLLCFPGLADFTLTGNTIRYYPQQDCTDESLRHLLLDQVLPRVWAHRGNLVLHAAALQLPNGSVIAISGDSGWGKSTLAAGLQARGAKLLGDDCICLRAAETTVELIASYRGLRLNPDSITSLQLENAPATDVAHYTAKRSFQVAPAQISAVNLDTLYLMQPPGSDQALEITTPTGSQLAPSLIKRSFLLDIREQASARRQMYEIAAVLKRLPTIKTLSYPRDFAELPSVCDALGPWGQV